MGTTTTTMLADDEPLTIAYSIINESEDIDVAVARLRDLLKVDHVVYHSSKLGASPSVDPFIRLTYPAAWIKQYLQNNYVDLDPVLREGFTRLLPFQWSELTVSTAEEMTFLHDALAHGVGPFGLSVPVIGKYGHRGLFSVSFSGTPEDWQAFVESKLPLLVEIANRVHQRVIREVFGEDYADLQWMEAFFSLELARNRVLVQLAQSELTVEEQDAAWGTPLGRVLEAAALRPDLRSAR